MIIGVGGISRAGKSTLAGKIKAHYQQEGKTVAILHQDNFVRSEPDIPTFRGRTDWEHPHSIDLDRLLLAIQSAVGPSDHVIVEGLMAFFFPELNRLYDKRFLVQVNKDTFLQRKKEDKRWGEEPDWYVEHIWDAYLYYGQPRSYASNLMILNGQKAFPLDQIVAFLES